MNILSLFKMLVECIPKGSSKQIFFKLPIFFSGNENINNFPNRVLLESCYSLFHLTSEVKQNKTRSPAPASSSLLLIQRKAALPQTEQPLS